MYIVKYHNYQFFLKKMLTIQYFIYIYIFYND